MIKVTDHAVLRYLQRVEGVDIEGVRRLIADSANKPWADKVVMFAGSTPFKIKAPNLICCVRAGVVTTCYRNVERHGAQQHLRLMSS